MEDNESKIMNIYSCKYVMNNDIDLFSREINDMIKKQYNNYNDTDKDFYSHLVVYENRLWIWDNLIDLS